MRCQQGVDKSDFTIQAPGSIHCTRSIAELIYSIKHLQLLLLLLIQSHCKGVEWSWSIQSLCYANSHLTLYHCDLTVTIYKDARGTISLWSSSLSCSYACDHCDLLLLYHLQQLFSLYNYSQTNIHIPIWRNLHTTTITRCWKGFTATETQMFLLLILLCTTNISCHLRYLKWETSSLIQSKNIPWGEILEWLQHWWYLQIKNLIQGSR